MHRLRTLAGLGLCATVFLMSASTARAQLLGTLTATGNSTLSGLSSSVLVSPSPSGPLLSGSPLDGIFSAIPVLFPGVIQGVTVGQGATSLPSFLTMAGYTFNMTSILPGNFSNAQCALVPAAGQVCTIPGSGFNWTNTTVAQSTGSFTFLGTVVTPTAQMFSIRGTYTATVFLPYQIAFVQFGSGPGQVAPYSLTIQAFSTVPEPSTIALTCCGLFATLAFASRRRTPA